MFRGANKVAYKLLLMAMASTVCFGQDDWSYDSELSILINQYQDSSARRSFNSISAFFKGELFEKRGFALGFARSETLFKNNEPDITENMFFANGRVRFFPSSIPASVGLALDAYYVVDYVNVDSFSRGRGRHVTVVADTEITDKITVLNPAISLFNYAKTLYLDVGFASSQYRSSDNSLRDLDVEQWTPTLGVGFNNQYDWIQLRAHVIRLSYEVTGVKDTAAGQFTWMHWFRKMPLNINHFFITATAGETIFSVDRDVHLVNTLSELQKSLVAVGLQWKLGESTHLTITAGRGENEALDANETYTNLFINGTVKWQW